MKSTRSVVVALAAVLGQFTVATAAVHAASYHVAPGGSDTANGDASAPFKSIQKGLDAATKPGDTLTIAGGVYHEELRLRSQGTNENPIVIQAASKQQVVVDGAQRVTGWKLIDAPHNVWGIEFGPKAAYVNDKGRWDLPPRSEQVFVDGKHCTHVKEDVAPAAMTDYTFTATLTDPARYTLKLPEGVNPDGALTEITVLKKLLDMQSSAAHVILDGITFRRAMNTYQENLAVVRGEAIEVKNCTFEYSSGGRGMDLSCNRSRIHDNIIRDNGCLGFAFHGADDVFENNTVSGNDLASYGEWEAGGTKIVGNGHVIRHNRFVNNLGGVAIWLDVYPSNCVIEDNFVSGNRGEGIRAETSFHNYIGYNIVENTQPCPYTDHGKTHLSPGIGISVQNSAETVVCNNFLKDNRGVDIQLFNYNRAEKNLPKWTYDYPDEKHRDWLNRIATSGVVYANDNLIFNNVIVQTTPQTSHACIWFRGGFDGKYASSTGNQIDYNFYWNTVTHAPTVQMGSVTKGFNASEVPAGTDVPSGNSQWQTKWGMDKHALGGFSPNDYAKTPFASDVPYAPSAVFAGLGKGNAMSHFVFAGHDADVDYAGNAVPAGAPISMGHFQNAAK